MYEKLPIRDVKLPIPDDERSCPYCNSPMDTLGYKFVREEIRITPAKVERIHYMQELLICPECKKDGDGTLVQAQAPASLLKHSPVSASMAAYIMYQRTFNSLPYYRQENDMAQLGALIFRGKQSQTGISAVQKDISCQSMKGCMSCFWNAASSMQTRCHARCCMKKERRQKALPICGYT